MNGITSIFLDTNAVIALYNGNESLKLFEDESIQFYTSFIVELETLGFPGISARESKDFERFFQESVIVYGYSEAIRKKVLDIRRTRKVKLPDAIIAASSIVYKIPLLTADARLAGLSELRVIQFEP
jgi:predicted nucleic acid-binding protein